MFSKYIILSVIFVISLQYGDASVIKDPNLEERIEAMWEKVNEAKTELLEKTSKDIKNTTDISENIRNSMVSVLVKIENDTKKHYTEVEQEARKIGTLDYMSPMMYVVKGLIDNKEELSELTKKAILEAENMNEQIQQKFNDFTDKVINWGTGCFNEVVEIQKTYPHEFGILEDAPDWNDFDEPVPSHYSPEVQATGRRINKVVKRCSKEYWVFEIELALLINDWVTAALSDILDKINELDTEM